VIGTARRLQADDTRRRLFGAAIGMFSSHGYHATTVDAIAKRAGVAKGTFFVHFATKDAVIVELVRNQTEAARAARVRALPRGSIAALRATVLALGEQAGQSRELSRAVLSATLDNPAVAGDADALFGAVLADMIEDARLATLRSGVDPDQLARGLMAVYLGAALHFTSSRTGEGMAELLEPLVAALLGDVGESSWAGHTGQAGNAADIPRRVGLRAVRH
jgi:AcrR family transcriptional regulator